MKLIYHIVMYCQGHYEGSFGSPVFLEMGRKEPGARHPQVAQEDASNIFTLPVSASRQQQTRCAVGVIDDLGAARRQSYVWRCCFKRPILITGS